MTATLEQVEKILWANDLVAGVLIRVPRAIKERMSLGTTVDALAPSLRKFLLACAGLSRPLAQAQSVGAGRIKGSTDLILLDEPFAVSTAQQQVLLDLIDDNVRGGATVICASSAALVSHFRSVLVLQDYAVPISERLQSRYMDRRFGRRSFVLSGSSREDMVTK